MSSLFTFDPKTSPPTPDGDEEAHLLDRVPPGGHRERLPELLAKLAAPHVHPEDDDYDDDRHDDDCDDEHGGFDTVLRMMTMMMIMWLLLLLF